MRSLNVLIACECSQVICLAFRRLGHNSFYCDLLPCFGNHPEFHILDDCLKIINGNCTFITCDGISHKDFFFKCLNCDCPHVCVENPLPLKCVGLPHPDDCVQPYYFGDPYFKRTLFWLKDLPCLVSSCSSETFIPWVVSSTHSGVAKNRYERSKSFRGIAAAMADQYSRYILSV